ncbi:plasmid mobilization protein [Filimonas effusa]|uniref:Plasmid mobilization relaxosome protein MobC n=1 Tax=Filimonas effusa TaxID=2508721 RepID=A0A4Q1D0J9_9BACT|nr:plasmid mobilization relaxosome protein MobC [Filimonas effusa]RXK81273.1 plasmid mobilization relaxosome protein MobC [Filimonas effusa]
MKQIEKSKYTRRVTIRFKPEEFQQVEAACKSSVHRKLSEYARRVLLNKPVTINYRNQSTDQLLTVLNLIKTELSAIGNNFNQSVHKLHTLDTVPQIKTWVVMNEATKKILMQKVEDIRLRLIQIYESCDRK